MKTIAGIALLIGSVAVLNSGCTASASVKKSSSNSTANPAVQVAYLSAPAAK